MSPRATVPQFFKATSSSTPVSFSANSKFVTLGAPPSVVNETYPSLIKPDMIRYVSENLPAANPLPPAATSLSFHDS